MDSKVQFTVIENGYRYIVEVYKNEYRNLMFLLRDHFLLDDFGECGGMGRCATCIIKATGIKGKSVVKERNEPATLAKMGVEDENIRLSCQIFITSDIIGSEMELFEK